MVSLLRLFVFKQGSTTDSADNESVDATAVSIISVEELKICCDALATDSADNASVDAVATSTASTGPVAELEICCDAM